MILALENVCKRFGEREVISGLTFAVPENTVYGFLGQNGAGKTTTMKMIVGLLKPSGGNIFVCGEKVRYGRAETNRNIGFLPDVPEYYGYMKPKEYLALCGEIGGLDRERTRKRAAELLDMVGLEKSNRKIAGFSRGMKQRLGIVQALLNEPKLLICDEPTSALDPVGRKEILDILLSLKGRTTILFSTHVLSDVERICDHVALLHQGKLALCGTMQELKQKHGREQISIQFEKPGDMESFWQAKGAASLRGNARTDGCMVVIHAEEMKRAQKNLYSAFAESGAFPLKVEVMEPSLESLFLEAVQ